MADTVGWRKRNKKCETKRPSYCVWLRQRLAIRDVITQGTIIRLLWSHLLTTPLANYCERRLNVLSCIVRLAYFHCNRHRTRLLV